MLNINPNILIYMGIFNIVTYTFFAIIKFRDFNLIDNLNARRDLYLGIAYIVVVILSLAGVIIVFLTKEGIDLYFILRHWPYYYI